MEVIKMAIQEEISKIVEDCLSNDVDPVDLVKQRFNCREAEIDREGDIWIADPQVGHWLSESELESFIEFVKS
jgi:hypothetical protein